MGISVLDIGCGNRKRAGAIGLDIDPDSSADVVHDLNRVPYPFGDSVFDAIVADNVIEHLENPVSVMEELHRIGKPDASVLIIVPYFRSQWAFIDPTHRRFFSTGSFTYFDPEHENCIRYKYSRARFRTERVVFNENIRRGPLTALVKAFANRWPERYETYCSHLYPLDDLSFYLRVVKNGGSSA